MLPSIKLLGALRRMLYRVLFNGSLLLFRPKIGLHKTCKPMDVLRKKKSSTLPRLLRERIIADYISGVKTPLMLSKEYPMNRNAIF